nr:substrate-binding domain-containing protein [Pseudomonas sp.]
MKKQLLGLIFSAVLSPLAMADVHIGVSIAQVDDVFLAQMRDYMVAHAKQLQGVTLQFEDAQGDVVRQLNQVQNFTSQGVDAIIVNPVDTAATAKITDDAQKAHIPLVYVNRRPDGDQLPPGVGYVGSPGVFRIRSNLGLLWEMGDYAVSYTARYYSGMKDYDSELDDNGNYRHVAATAFNDMQVSYQLPWNATVRLGLNNVFDRDPPVAFHGSW